MTVVSPGLFVKADYFNPITKNASQPQNPKPQTQKSVAFHTLAFCLWHYDRIPCEVLTLKVIDFFQMGAAVNSDQTHRVIG